MIKGIIIWVLKMFLGGLFKNIQNKEAEAARRERDAAIVGVQSVDEAKKTEDNIRRGVDEAEKAFKARQPAEDDPFNYKGWNSGS